MRLAHERRLPEDSISNLPPHRKVLLAGLLLALALLAAAGCGQRDVRVTVTPEDVLRANKIASEGDAAFDRKDFYAALIKYLEAYGINPNSEYLCNRLGIAYTQLNLYGEAGQYFRRAILLNKKYPYPHNNLGSIYFAQNNWRQAEKHFKKAISLNPNDASFHMNLGSVYFEKRKREQAKAEWRRSLELDPEIFSKESVASLSSSGSSLSERHFFLAGLMAAEGNTRAAIENLKLAFNNGFTDLDAIRTSADFDRIRKDEEFDRFLKDVAIWLKFQPKDDVLQEPG